MPKLVPDTLAATRDWRPVKKRVELRILLWAVLAACIIRQWIMPLSSSFWVDEMGTAFVVHHGAADPSLRVAPQVAASLYYALPRLAERMFGFSEVVYRFPSVIAMAAALALIARIAMSLIHPDAGWFAAFACLALRGFNYEAADARPYALGACAASLAFWFLVRWAESGRWRDGLLFAAAASLLWRVHLIFWPIYFVFALYAVVCLLRGDKNVTWMRAGIVFGALGVSLIPVLTDALHLFRQAGAHVVAPRPSLTDLSGSLKLGFITSCVAALSVISRRLRWPTVLHLPDWTSLSLVLGWWLCHPLCLFAFSWITGNSVFVPRYLFIALGGAGLTVTALAAMYIRSSHWRPIALVLGVGVFIFMGSWRQVWPPHHNSDWRKASEQLNRVAGPGVPVIAPSPFIEARPPVWRPDYPLNTFLYSHLIVYPIAGRLYPFPFETSTQAEAAAARLTRETLVNSPKFAILGGDRSVLFWTAWFRARPELGQWRPRRLGPFADVDVVVFEKAESVSCCE
jgi:Dolichyl-phosphate-mannose-protein mannosyltransferase